MKITKIVALSIGYILCIIWLLGIIITSVSNDDYSNFKYIIFPIIGLLIYIICLSLEVGKYLKRRT